MLLLYAGNRRTVGWDQKLPVPSVGWSAESRGELWVGGMGDTGCCRRGCIFFLFRSEAIEDDLR